MKYISSRYCSQRWVKALSKEVTDYMISHDDIYTSAEIRKIFHQHESVVYAVLKMLSDQCIIRKKKIKKTSYYWCRG